MTGAETAASIAVGLRGGVEGVRKLPGAKDWQPSCALVDDSAAEHAALRSASYSLLFIM